MLGAVCVTVQEYSPVMRPRLSAGSLEISKLKVEIPPNQYFPVSLSVYVSVLSYSDGVDVVEGSQFGGESSGPIFLDLLHCTGDEESLSECGMYTEPGIHMCGHQHDVGVICYRKMCIFLETFERQVAICLH